MFEAIQPVKPVRRLRDLLEGAKGRFILSINDRPGVREIFAGMAFAEVGLNYRFNGVTPARELIIHRL